MAGSVLLSLDWGGVGNSGDDSGVVMLLELTILNLPLIFNPL